VLELLVLGATLALAALATGARSLRRHTAERALDRYARSRGLSFVPHGGRAGTSPRVLGTVDGIDFVVDLYRSGDELRTRVAATAPRGRAPQLSVLQRSSFSLQAARPLERLDDVRFDAAFAVRRGTGEDVAGLVDVVRPLLVLEKRSGVWLRSDGWKIAISWTGAESDPVMLDAARDVVVGLGGRHRPDVPYR
jgi:hypothetical protein